jgi:hypothetical protein
MQKPTVRSLTPERRKRELEMMQTPDRWPVWPALCLKKIINNGAGVQCGVLIEGLLSTRIQPIIYDRIHGEVLETFDSFEALVDAGWVVD